VIVAGDIGYTLGVRIGNPATVGTVSSGRTQTVPVPIVPNHTGTINAFGRTINVTGVSAISAGDFNTAKGKLQAAMTALDENINDQTVRNKLTNMLNRVGFAIIIETGGVGPNANASKSMTIGVDYLLANDAMPTIAVAIRDKVDVDNAFAMLKLNARDIIRMAKAPVNSKVSARSA
jgi:hypothetical protein